MIELDRSSYVPLYLQIQRQLRGKVGIQWKPGDRFPSDHEVADLYQVSRVTARQAVAALVQEGLIERRRGAGTYVADKRPLDYDLGSDLTSSEQWLVQNAGVDRKVLRYEEVPCPVEEATYLNLEPGSPVTHYVRIRLVSGRRVAVDSRYLLVDLGRQLKPEWVEREPLNRILHERFGVTVATRVREFQAIGADREVAAWLEVPLRIPVLAVRMRLYSPSRDTLMSGISYYKGEDVSIRHVSSNNKDQGVVK